MPQHRNDGPPAYTPSSDEERILLARYAIALMKWRWFAGSEVVRSRDEQDLIPPLLFGLYIVKKLGKMITKGEACDLMDVDKSTTGPKFIKALADDDLISIKRYPKIDKRKDFVIPTPRLERLVEEELLRLARNLRRFADDLDFLSNWSGIDVPAASRVPSVRPSSSNLLPVDWPADEVGMPLKLR